MSTRPRASWIRLILLLPFVAMIWVSSYNRIEPTFGGLPFFFWYQLLWIVIAAALVYLVYRVEHPPEPGARP